MPKTQVSDTELSERAKSILHLIVENFVRNATPVGSKYIASHSDLALSPASIRNVMKELERQGYVTQPHTSAGRMPTDKGYRFYVDSLMRRENLSESEKRRILHNLQKFSNDLNFILEEASHSLAKISNLLGVALAPRFYEGIIDKIELISLAEKKILVVISIKSGLVKTISLELNKDVPREKLERAAGIINERLHGLTLNEIKRTIDARLKNIAFDEEQLIDSLIDSSRLLFDFTPPADLHIGGATNIISQPEFFMKDTSKYITGLLDDREVMIHVLTQDETREDEPQGTTKIKITIGVENTEELMRHCSLITASYHAGEIRGTIGVLGPTRMYYSKVIALVDYMAKALTEMLTPGMAKN